MEFAGWVLFAGPDDLCSSTHMGKSRKPIRLLKFRSGARDRHVAEHFKGLFSEDRERLIEAASIISL
jgi:hypothetical protein